MITAFFSCFGTRTVNDQAHELANDWKKDPEPTMKKLMQVQIGHLMSAAQVAQQQGQFVDEASGSDGR